VVRPSVQLLYFGRLDTNKNVEWVIDLCRSRKEFHLDIVGRGDDGYVRALRDRAGEALGSRVRFLGELADSEIDEVLKRIDCLVFPSSYEGFGITLVEGMATGIPTVASDIEPYRSIVGNVGVPLVALGDVDGLEQAILSVLSCWPGTPVVERALEYSWDTRGHFLIDLYRRLACFT
jgi:glycosyltransferase involved in cell wall biosynthesis